MPAGGCGRLPIASVPFPTHPGRQARRVAKQQNLLPKISNIASFKDQPRLPIDHPLPGRTRRRNDHWNPHRSRLSDGQPLSLIPQRGKHQCQRRPHRAADIFALQPTCDPGLRSDPRNLVAQWSIADEVHGQAVNPRTLSKQQWSLLRRKPPHKTQCPIVADIHCIGLLNIDEVRHSMNLRSRWQKGSQHLLTQR